MKITKLANSFSLQMLGQEGNYENGEWKTTLTVKEIDLEKVKEIFKEKSYLADRYDENLTITHDCISFVGHQETANILSKMLGWKILMNRKSFHIEEGETIVVAQYVGERLPEGATTLPEGATIRFFLVKREQGSIEKRRHIE